MDDLLFHPRVVHVPVALGVLMPLVALGIWLAWWSDWLPRRTWLVVVVLQAVLAASAFAAHRSGEDQEDAVEKVVPEEAIHEHEEAADWMLWASAIALVLVAAPPFVPPARAALALALLGTLATFVVCAITFRTGRLGGELVYEHGAARAYETAHPPAQ
jgi:uncharacterized membrane protein